MSLLMTLSNFYWSFQLSGDMFGTNISKNTAYITNDGKYTHWKSCMSYCF